MPQSRVVLVCLLALVLPVLGGLTPVQAATAPPPVRVMVNGDSISQGFDGDQNWRYFLWKEIQSQHLAVDMVGPFDKPHVTPGWHSASYASSDFDADHDAVGGTTLGSWRARVGHDVAQQHPQVLVVELGINDLRAGTSPTTLLAELRQYVAAAQAAEPSVTIVLSSVLPIADPTRPGIDHAVAQYDDLVRDSLTSLSTADSRVTLANTTQGWSASSMTWDGIHPKPLGASLIARNIASALSSSGAVPGMKAPAIPLVSVWWRNAAAVVRLVGRRAMVTWDNETITSTRILVQRTGRGGTVRWRHVYVVRGGGSHAHLRTKRLAKGHYRFRISVTRKTMTSAYGPVSYVDVTGARHRRHA